MDSNSLICDDFFSAYKAGKICLHPTDTIPGLTADPDCLSAVGELKSLKGRMQTKPFVGLVSSLEVASAFWKPLPTVWPSIIENLWPCSLSIIWEGSSAAPKSLLGLEGSLCLRQPQLEEQWFADVLAKLAKPLPTTSVNFAGEAAVTNWDEAAKFLQSKSDRYNTFVPHYQNMNRSGKLSSTIIKLLPNGDFQLLRTGGVSVDHIIGVCHQFDPMIKQVVKGDG